MIHRNETQRRKRIGVTLESQHKMTGETEVHSVRLPTTMPEKEEDTVASSSGSVSSPAKKSRVISKRGKKKKVERTSIRSPRSPRFDLLEYPSVSASGNDSGPPPDMKKRQLIFDSLQKIVGSTFKGRGGNPGDSRGTYVYTFGAGYHGQLGRKFVRGQKKYATTPTMVPMDAPIRQVACGGLHTAAVTDSGTVYTWGDGRACQLGHLHEGFSNQQTPRPVDALVGVAKLTMVSCGQSHTVALSDRGELYAWGFNKYGQLGSGERQSIKIPKRVMHPEDGSKPVFRDVSCGEKHTVAITADGQAYSFGCGEHGQLGHGDQQDQLRPKLIESLAGISMKSVVCGAIHTVFLSTDGGIYVCGFGEHFYANEEQNFFYTPKKVPFKDPVVQVACGQSHIIALTNKGDVYAWGSGHYGQLGHGIVGHLNTPRLVLYGKSIAQIAAGRYHSMAVTNFGALYTWGCGESGQLGHNSDDNVLIPRLVECVVGTITGQLASGEHHSALLTSAPYSRLTEDTLTWFHFERVEYDLKVKNLRMLQQGLTRKDLLRLEESMREYREVYFNHQKKIKEEEEQEIRSDVMGIRRTSSIIIDVLKEREKEFKELQEEIQRQKSADAFEGNPNAQTAVSKSDSSSSSAPSSPAPAGGDKRKHARESKDKSGNAMGGAQAHTATAAAADGDDSKKDDAYGSWMLTGIDEDHYGEKPMASSSNLLDLVLPGPANDGNYEASPSDSTPAGRRIGKKNKTKGGRGGSLTARGDLFSSRNGGGAASPTGEGSSLPRIHSARRAAMDEEKGTNCRASYLKENSAVIQKLAKLVSQNGRSNSDLYVKRLTDSVFAARKECDQLKNVMQEKERRLEKLERTVEALSGEDIQLKQREEHQERLKGLEMKLDTVTIKINETEENRKNYELNISHLKQEESERYFLLEALRRQCAETDEYYKKINEEKVLALSKKDRAEGELERFRLEIQDNAKFMMSQLLKFEAIARAKRDREERRMTLDRQRHKSRQKKMTQRILKLRAEVNATEKEASDLASRRNRINDKVRYYERRFQQLVSATGLTSPGAIINKFELKEEIKKQLETELQQKEIDIAAKKEELETLEKELGTFKTNFKDSKWRDVDNKQERFREAEARSWKHHSEYEKVVQRRALLQEGITTLFTKIGRVCTSLAEGKLSPEEEKTLDSSNPWSSTDCTSVMSKLQAQLKEIQHVVNEASAVEEEQEEESAPADEGSATLKPREEVPQLAVLTKRATMDRAISIASQGC